jgi:hypothetical protein
VHRAAWLEFNIPYVQNNFLAFDITQLRRNPERPPRGAPDDREFLS